MKSLILKNSFLIIIILFTSKYYSQIIFTEDFEGVIDDVTNLPSGWAESGLSNDLIYFVGDETDANSAGAWGVPPHTLFAMTNDDACNCDKSEDRIILPAIDLSSYSGNINLIFEAVNDNFYGGITTLEISLDNGITWEVVETLATTSGTNEWQNFQIPINQYIGNQNVLISFLYNDEQGWALGFALDDVSIELENIVIEDNDGDGVLSDIDCDDNNFEVYQEMLVYIDNDMDSYVSGDTTICMGATIPNGFILTPLGFDCDDYNAGVNPGAVEIPGNGIDENCDGDDPILPVDNDGDNFTSDVDCNDNNINIYPGAPEIINNGIDEDCNGEDSTSTNSQPIATDDSATCLSISDVDINILANDSDSDGNLVPSSIVITTSPSNGTVVVNFTTGVVTYTPNVGFYGTDVFCYTICDDGSPEACANACVTVTVQNAEPPLAVDDNTSVFIGETASILILQNDNDPNSEIVPWNGYTVDLDPQTPGIQLSYISSNPNSVWNYNSTFQSLTFNSSDNAEGVYVLEYELCDPQGLCDIATVTVNVLENISSISENDNEKNIILPNPFVDKIKISNYNNIDEMYVVSMDSKIIKISNLNNGIVDLNNLNSGTYFLKIILKDNTVVREKIIKL